MNLCYPTKRKYWRWSTLASPETLKYSGAWCVLQHYVEHLHTVIADFLVQRGKTAAYRSKEGFSRYHLRVILRRASPRCWLVAIRTCSGEKKRRHDGLKFDFDVLLMSSSIGITCQRFNVNGCVFEAFGSLSIHMKTALWTHPGCFGEWNSTKWM